MPNSALIVTTVGTPPQIVFRSSGNSFGISAGADLRMSTSTYTTSCIITMDSVANGNNSSTGGRQSHKVDLGEPRAERYTVRGTIEFAAAPTTGNVVEFYWAPATSAASTTGNLVNLSGTDASFSGYSSNLGDSLFQLTLIGYGVCTSNTFQKWQIGTLTPGARYGQLVVNNRSGAAMPGSAGNFHVVFDPMIPQIN